MAEGEGIGAAFGAEEDAAENRREGGNADGIGVAIALDAAHHDPALSPAVRRFLNRQRALVDLQIQHFDVEHRLAIAAARRKALIDRMRICLQGLIAIVIAGVIVGFGLMVWDAAHDRGIVIDTFSVPEDLAQRGFTGEALARRILDRLAAITRESASVRAASTYANGFGSDITLEIPETGVSIGQLSRMLREKLGHITHIGGEVTRTGDQVSVHIRVGDVSSVESSGPAATLAAVVQDAATRIYARTEPYRYGYWLFTRSDFPAAAAVFRQLAVSGPRIEQVWAMHGLALVADTFPESVQFDQQALQLDPGFFLSHLTRADTFQDMGHDEQALREAEVVIAAAASGEDSGVSEQGERGIRADAKLVRDEEVGDYRGAMVDTAQVRASFDDESRSLNVFRSTTEELIGLHDDQVQAALDLLSDDASMSNPRNSYLRAEYLAGRGEWPAAIAALERARAAFGQLDVRTLLQSQFRYSLLLAEAYARVGRSADAEAALATIPADVYDGWRIRGRVATLHHDFVAAEKAFAEAVRQAPSIPRAYLDWGDLLAAQGNLSGAIAKYSTANRLGPHWADPLKAWGDALTRQGQVRQALKKYREGLRYAPNWAALKALAAG